jgi:putative ABC transport system permease protein
VEAYLDGLARDFRYALRNLRKDRRFASVAIFALALGLGASTVVFSVVYNSIFEALPYRNFQKLVVFEIRNLANAGGWKGRNFFSPAEFRSFRERNHVFEDMTAYEGVRLQFDDGKSIRYWPRGATVSGNTFEFLGVAPYLGRTLSEEDAKPDAPYVFVMNYRFWQSEFGGDPKVLGTNFILEGKPRTLVGIMPRHFNVSA